MKAAFDPELERLERQRAGLAESLMAGGIPAGLQGVLERQVIPSTINALTAAGLGRTGAVGEAVAQASLGQVTGLLQSLLTGVPAAAVSGAGTQKKEPGVFDYLSLAGGIAAGFCWMARAAYGGECLPVNLIRAWILRHRRIASVYRLVGPRMPWLGYALKPAFVLISRRMVREMTIRA